MRLTASMTFGLAALFCVVYTTCSVSLAQAPPPATVASKGLTVDRIYGQPSLSGQMTAGLAWSADGKQLSFFKETPAERGGETKKELWVLAPATGQARLLLPSDKLAAMLPAEAGNAAQATGLRCCFRGRRRSCGSI
jgi:dipeptidyl-peptidase 4